MKTLCVIPARLNSTRLPRKMLQKIGKYYLIQLTYLHARECQDVDHFVVATDSEEIAAVIEHLGADVCFTDPNAKTGSDRVAEVAKSFPNMDIIINLQGDEPFIRPQMLSTLIQPFHEKNPPVMSTLANDLDIKNDHNNPNFVKVIVDKNNDAIYFSRAPIPFLRSEHTPVPVFHHIGLYAYQRDFLIKFAQFEQTSLEKIESLEQLRAIENGHKIRVCYTKERTLEINTPEELTLAQDRLKNGELNINIE